MLRRTDTSVLDLNRFRPDWESSTASRRSSRARIPLTTFAATRVAITMIAMVRPWPAAAWVSFGMSKKSSTWCRPG